MLCTERSIDPVLSGNLMLTRDAGLYLIDDV